MLMSVPTLYTTIVRTRYVTRYFIETRVWRVLPDGTKLLIKSFKTPLEVEPMSVPPETRITTTTKASQPTPEEAETV